MLHAPLAESFVDAAHAMTVKMICKLVPRVVPIRGHLAEILKAVETVAVELEEKTTRPQLTA
jgi:hypothetical protein